MSERRPRVAMVTPYFLPHNGGVEQHVAEVARRINASGAAEVTVLTTGAEDGLAERETVSGTEVRRFHARPRGRDWLWCPEIGRTLRDEPWDLVHVQSYHTLVAPAAMVTAARHNIPYVVTFHGGGHSSALRTRVRGLQRRLLGPLLRRADRLVAVAGFEIDDYGAELHVPRERFALIPNGFDLPDPGEPAATDPGTLIASIGRLERYKGHQHVIAALPHVLEAVPEARLWIAGAGPYEHELRDQAQRLGVSARVSIEAVAAGDRAEMARRVAAADAVVLMSSYETHPVAALEAIALGRPVLVAPGSGFGELAAKGLARTCDPEPPEQLAAEIVRVVNEPFTPASAELPDWDACAAGLAALYREVLERRCAS